MSARTRASLVVAEITELMTIASFMHSSLAAKCAYKEIGSSHLAPTTLS